MNLREASEQNDVEVAGTDTGKTTTTKMKRHKYLMLRERDSSMSRICML